MKTFSTFAPARRLDVRMEESWLEVQKPYRWLVERDAPPEVISE
jgi:hypothetical protein